MVHIMIFQHRCSTLDLQVPIGDLGQKSTSDIARCLFGLIADSSHVQVHVHVLNIIQFGTRRFCRTTRGSICGEGLPKSRRFKTRNIPGTRTTRSYGCIPYIFDASVALHVQLYRYLPLQVRVPSPAVE